MTGADEIAVFEVGGLNALLIDEGSVGALVVDNAPLTRFGDEGEVGGGQVRVGDLGVGVGAAAYEKGSFFRHFEALTRL